MWLWCLTTGMYGNLYVSVWVVFMQVWGRMLKESALVWGPLHLGQAYLQAVQKHRCIFFSLLVPTQCQGRQDRRHVIYGQHHITVMGAVSGTSARQDKYHQLRSLGSCNDPSTLGEYCDCSLNWSLKQMKAGGQSKITLTLKWTA